MRRICLPGCQSIFHDAGALIISGGGPSLTSDSPHVLLNALRVLYLFVKGVQLSHTPGVCRR